MAKKRKTDPGGRPKEYAETLKLISLSLPESLIEKLDQIASESDISRQRLINECLKLMSMLKSSGFVRVTAIGTIFQQFPVTSEENGDLFTSMTNMQLAERCVEIAKERPDDPVTGGVSLIATRDQGQKLQEMLRAIKKGGETTD